MEGVRFPIRFLSEADIVWKSGIPVTRVEATIASLVDSDEDASLVADAFVEAIRKYGTVDMDIRELRKQLGADRYDKLLRAAEIAPFGEAKLVETDGMGHVALIEKKEG